MTKLQIDYMRQSGKLVADIFNHLKTLIVPGITGIEINAIVEKMISTRGARPAFKNYSSSLGGVPFPASICWSVNEQVIHGLPSSIAVKDGDLVSVDLGVELNGYYADSAYTFLVGNVDAQAREMSDCTQLALLAAIAVCEPGNYIGDIGKAIEFALKGRYSIVRDFCGHGIGQQLHEKPSIIHYFNPKRLGPKMVSGMVLAIEPMINLGTEKVKICEDQWTVITDDGKVSCHWEHTVAITDDGPIVLTSRGDGF